MAFIRNIAQALLTFAFKQLAQGSEMPIGKGFLGFGKKRSKNRKTLTPAPLFSQVPVQVQLQLSYKYSVINFEDKC
tara:strand:+ start:339 stop:566 length:228 start_codon:yes stop_codon:yes gene_type:complete